MEYAKLLITVISTFFHSSCKNWFNSSIFDGFRFSTHVLDGINIRTIAGPVDCFWHFVCQKLFCYSTGVFRIVILLISPPTSKLLFCPTKKMFSKYFNVKRTIHDCSNRMARYLTFDTKSSPHHYFCLFFGILSFSS